MKIRKIKKEVSITQRILSYSIVALIVIICIVGSYFCFTKQNENVVFVWWSDILLNIGAGTAITAIFIYVSEVRLRRYRLQESLDNLRYLIYRINSLVERMERGAQEQKQNHFRDFISFSKYKKIDNDIIESSKPKIYNKLVDFQMCYHEYIAEILKQSENYDIDYSGEIINLEFVHGININTNIKEFSKNLIESCNNLKALLV